MFGGSPATPPHPLRRRLAYAAVGTLIGSVSTFGNALVTVNVASLSGALGLYIAQLSWLPAVYVAMNASANLTLVKARAQFGIPAVTRWLLGAYLVACLLQFVWPGFAAAVLLRAICGMAAAALTTLGIYYWLQVFTASLRPLALVIGISLTQLGTPLARLLPVQLLTLDHWYGLHLIEIATALAVLAATAALPLPPSERSRAFEPLDALSIALLVPAYLLLAGVLGLGRVLWWADTPWLGTMLAAAIPLFALAIAIERRRARPLVQAGWLGSLDILRFAAVAMLVRVALAEQTYGAVGLMTAGGLTNDQLRVLFACVALAMLLGMVAAVLSLSERRLPYQVVAAALIIAFGAWLDTGVNHLTRPAQLYGSQALIGFGTTLFMGPALVYGFSRMIRQGGSHLVSFVVLFSTTQNLGGLAGSALLGSYQIAAAREHAQALAEHLPAADPLVAERLRSGALTLASTSGDAALATARSAGLLAQTMTREAGVLAYIDVFRLVATLALGAAAYVSSLLILAAWRRRRYPPQP